MATTTPNYGWTVPTSTDLVKDGATAIETLGDAIDASMNTALGTKKAGMVLLNTTSFSGVASQNFPSVFSATYDSYLIVFTFNGSTNAKAGFRVSTDSSPITTSTYGFKTILSGTNSDTISQTRNGGVASYAELGDIASGAGAGYIGGSMTVSNPFLATRTAIAGIARAATSGDVYFSSFIGENTNNTSYNGFALTCSTGNITGFASVYGFNK
jgi:hypothetical protein